MPQLVEKELNLDGFRLVNVQGVSRFFNFYKLSSFGKLSLFVKLSLFGKCIVYVDATEKIPVRIISTAGYSDYLARKVNPSQNGVICEWTGNELNELLKKVPELTTYNFDNKEELIGIVIPNSITVINKEQFKGCWKLLFAVIPSSVSIIGENAFEGCYMSAIYAEAEKKPLGWDNKWNPGNRHVNWGFHK
ncbi:MAG: leucine-rich repeat domain-containing protein [Bacillales bacterium]|jgi:hypothetical protein|nr:leucine-rich repeat domain-containing protein [Bacillales bacterium]